MAAKVPPKTKKMKGLSKDALLNFDKNVLAEKIIQLEAHNEQLKNKISKNLGDGRDCDDETSDKRSFDFTNCHYRRVLLHILYFGWNYHGFVVQEDTNQTVEHHLFHALKKSCLIETREKSEYNRCGRTDKGVSAYGQVISITLRSKHELSEQNLQSSLLSEMPYCKILNRLLPKDIRAIAWLPIPADISDFSARFNCRKRQYKYYFPKASLDVSAMREACQLLIGEHDFRHLCKMDVGNNVTNFRREVYSADIISFDDDDYESATSMYTFVIEANGFLYHQIRYIMAVLILIGEGKESPTVLSELLDVDTYPRKPQYSMALDIPLNLFNCTYEIEGEWYYDESELKNVIIQLQNDWTIHNVKTTMIKDCVSNLEVILDSLAEKQAEERLNTVQKDRVVAHANCLLQGVKPKTYVPLLERESCSSLEERIEHYTRKRKIVEVE